MNKIDDQKALDINNLIHYIVWSRDKIAGGVKQEEAVNALSRLIDYPVNLMHSVAGYDKETKPEKKFSLDLIYDLKSIVGMDAIKETYDSLELAEDKIEFLETVDEYHRTEYWKTKEHK